MLTFTKAVLHLHGSCPQSWYWGGFLLQGFGKTRGRSNAVLRFLCVFFLIHSPRPARNNSENSTSLQAKRSEDKILRDAEPSFARVWCSRSLEHLHARAFTIQDVHPIARDHQGSGVYELAIVAAFGPPRP